MLQVPTTQRAKISMDPKFVELTADVLEIVFIKYRVAGTTTKERLRIREDISLEKRKKEGKNGLNQNTRAA